MGDLERNKVRILIRDARPDDAPFLAKCIMAGMHFYDFESGIPEEDDLFRRLTACERRDDLLYTYKYSRVAEVDDRPVGSLLSYPGGRYKRGGVVFTRIEQEDAHMHSLFADTAAGEREARLSEVIDCVHRSFGREALLFGVQGDGQFHMAKEHCSPHYTTRWADIPGVIIQ